MVLASDSRLVMIDREVDLYVAREAARLIAAEAGFDTFQCADIETAVSELCSNVLRYGVKGRALLRKTPMGFEVEVVDQGPGFGAAPKRRGGLGIGLAGAGRLMDELTVDNLPEGGRVFARKLLARGTETAGSWWSAVAASATIGGTVVGGDAFYVEESDRGLLVAVMDGLGHGEGAAAAAAAVSQCLREHPDDEPDQLIIRADRAARHTRGAVAVVARIDPKASVFSYAGVGDVSAIVLPDHVRLTAQSGCLGVRIPAVGRREMPWQAGWGLAMWTDGAKLGEDVSWPDPAGATPTQWVESLLTATRSERDDALILLITSVSER